MTIQNLLNEIKEKNYTDIIFDFDETLCTLHIDWAAWGEDILSFIHQYEPGFANPHNHREMNNLVKTHGGEYRKKLIEINRHLEKKYFSGYSRNVTALSFLKACSGIARVHLWTSNFNTTLDQVLEELGIDNLFRTKVFNNSVTYMKPDPDGFSYINTGDVPPGQFLFIGDSDSDRGASEALGIRFVHVLDIQS